MKVSIIVPVYKAEKSLQRCIDSLLAQTLQDFEIILIDDGSPDRSGVICDEYSSKDKRVKTIHKQNEGVSAARQTGIDVATGEYIIHADSDDWVEPTMLEELYGKAKHDDADVVICDYYFEDALGRQFVRKQKPSSLSSEIILCELFQQLHGSCCNKLVKKVCYNRYNIKFPIGINYCEDLLTWIQLYKNKCVKTTYLPKAFYHYCFNEDSITRHYTRSTYDMRLEYQHKIENVLCEDKYEPLRRRAAFSVYFEALIYNVLTKEETKEGLRKYRKEILKKTGLRWRLSFMLLYLGQYDLAHRFLHF